MSCSRCYNNLTYKEYGVFCDKCNERVVFKVNGNKNIGVPLSQIEFNTEHPEFIRMQEEVLELEEIKPIDIVQFKLREITLLDISPIGHPVDDYYGWVTKTYGIQILKTEFNNTLKKKFNYHVKDSKWNY